jgi:hypothetical protein
MKSAGELAETRAVKWNWIVALAMVCASVSAEAWCAIAQQPQDIRVTDNGFGYQLGRDGGRREFRFSELGYVAAQGNQVCYGREKNAAQPEVDKSLSVNDARSAIASDLEEAFDIGQKGNCLPLFWKHKDSAQNFANAVDRMIWENSAEAKAQRQQQFDQQVAAWRAAGSKVEAPEEAQRHFVIAQAAFQEKNFAHQAEELSAALQIYPTWPAEQFDLALILGELTRYSEAIQHMQMYLALMPDAPDAQRAKQQIWIWQDKLQQSAQAAPPVGTPNRKTAKK